MIIDVKASVASNLLIMRPLLVSSSIISVIVAGPIVNGFLIPLEVKLTVNDILFSSNGFV